MYDWVIMVKSIEIVFGFLFVVLASAVFVCAVPLSSHTFGGAVYVDGVLLTSEDTDYSVSLEVGGVELARYTMGNYSSYDGYNLIVPMDTDCSLSSAACEGDEAYVYVNDMSVNENPVEVGAPAGYTVMDISVDYEVSLSLDVVPLNVDAAPVSVVSAVVSVTPVGVYNLTIDDFICKDVDGGGCEYLVNPSDEISIVFEDTDGLVVMTDSGGEAVIMVMVDSPLAIPETKYVYYVRTEDGEWIEATVTVQSGEIPEFPIIFLPVLLMFLSFSMVKKFS